MFQLSVIGHILYDIRCYVRDFPLPDRTSFTNGRIKYSSGGSACNTAVAASKQGIRSTLCGRIGFDEYGIYLIDNLLKEKIDAGNMIVSYDSPTGISVIMIDEGAQVEIVEMIGANEPISPKDIKEDFLKTSWLHMTGTNVSALIYIANMAEKHGIPISFDPGRSLSYSGYENLKPVLKKVKLLVSNKSEVASIFGYKPDVDERTLIHAIDEVLPETIFIIKNGRNPTIVKEDRNFLVPCFKVKAVDTLGAGDALAGGLISGLMDNDPIEDAVMRANATAALTIQKEGAQTSPTKEEVMAFLEENRNNIEIKYL